MLDPRACWGLWENVNMTDLIKFAIGKEPNSQRTANELLVEQNEGFGMNLDAYWEVVFHLSALVWCQTVDDLWDNVDVGWSLGFELLQKRLPRSLKSVIRNPLLPTCQWSHVSFGSDRSGSCHSSGISQPKSDQHLIINLRPGRVSPQKMSFGVPSWIQVVKTSKPDVSCCSTRDWRMGNCWWRSRSWWLRLRIWIGLSLCHSCVFDSSEISHKTAPKFTWISSVFQRMFSK